MNEGAVNDFVEITLAKPDDFLKVKETLSRIGISSNKTRVLYQSCHIFHKRGRYYVVHFKELFKLDGKPTDITEVDIARRNTICRLLAEWGLVSIVDSSMIEAPQAEVKSIKILPYHEKSKWTVRTKYSLGNS